MEKTKKLSEYPRHELMALDFCLALAFIDIENMNPENDASLQVIRRWTKRINQAIKELDENDLPQ